MTKLLNCKYNFDNFDVYVPEYKSHIIRHAESFRCEFTRCRGRENSMKTEITRLEQNLIPLFYSCTVT